jgi:hypothetical protein
MIESVKRYYSNSFTDAEKQAAMNLFLGIYDPALHQRLESDYFLHNTGPFIKPLAIKSYIYWWSVNLYEKPKPVFDCKCTENIFVVVTE